MRHQIFLPDAFKPAAAELQKFDKWIASVGLPDHAQDATHIRTQGPEDQGGLMVGWIHSRGNRTIDYRPNDQIWIPAAPVDGGEPGRYWVGFNKNKPPRESDLRRPYTQTEGEWTQLGDDRWKLPTPRTVPKSAQYMDDGTMRWFPVREFAWLVDEAEKYREELREKAQQKLTLAQIDPTEFVEWLLKLLQVNYLLPRELAAELELWRDGSLVNAVLLSLGLQQVSEGDDNGE